MMEGPQIYTLIPAIMRDIGSIGKDRTNTMQGYAFRGIDDCYNALHEPLSKHGVFVVPCVLERWREERPSKQGGLLFYTTLKVSHKFYAPDGSNVDAVTVGEALDSGDKSTNKAMSAAMKYALIEVFAIPTKEDNDTESESHEVAYPQPAPPQRVTTPRPQPQAPPQPERPPQAPAAPAQRPAAAPAQVNPDGSIRAKVFSVSRLRHGVHTDGTTWALHVIVTDKGEFKCFDEAISAAALEMVGAVAQLWTVTKTDPKTKKTADYVEQIKRA